MSCPECKSAVANFLTTGQLKHTCATCGGNMDIYIATRAKVTDDWSTPRNLSVDLKFPTVGSAETRPSLSWDLQRLYYGADGQVYTSTRAKTN